jgi:hypothetical protein
MKRRNLVPKIQFSIALIITLTFLPGMVLAFSGGPPDHVCADPPDYTNCTMCHSSFTVNSGAGYVALTGLPTAYTPGTTYPISVTTAMTGQLRWGFELTAIKADGSRGGQLVVTDPTNTQLSVNVTYNRDFMKHTSAGSFPGTPNSHTWTASWTAPIAGTGTVTFFLAGNAANNSSTNAGDYIFIMNTNVHQAGALPSLDVTLSPISPPIMVPMAGGSFSFNASVQRTVGPQAPFTVWARAKNPNGTYTGPLLGPVSINPPVGTNVTRLRNQNIPGSWVTGFYSYLGYANTSFTYPAIDSSTFTFTKLATLVDGPMVWDFNCYGEPFPFEMEETSALASEFRMMGANPNPFNPTTAISYKLQASRNVSLKVFDATGRLVTELVNGWREAGTHEVTFDGSNLSSGVYLYSIQAGPQTATGKMVLMK